MITPDMFHSKELFFRPEKTKRSHVIILIVCGLLATVWLVSAWFVTAKEINSLSSSLGTVKHSDVTSGSTRAKPPKQIVKALYLTAYSAGNPKKIDEMIKLIDETELNAVVIDIKDYSGLVLYNSQVGLIKQLGLKDNRLGDVPALIKKLHDHNIYVIARQTVFQDPELAEKRPEWAIKDKRGGLWRDRKGLTWVDTTNKKIWRHNLNIAQEAIALGFDEINFDYVRFPSDGDMNNIVLNLNGRKKYEVMRDFFTFLNQHLAKEPAWISLDFFGLTTEAVGENDLSIGQRIVDVASEVDYICPMMYPSHYFSGHLGFKNPAEHPAEVIENGMKAGLPLFKDARAGFRPWLQAFDLGAVYDAAKIRAQIDMVEKYADTGWLLWNAANRYTKNGLKES